MALSGLDVYKLLPKTNCKECGFATCLAFAMQLAKKAVAIDKCPSLSPEAKQALEASSQPPIKLVSIGSSDIKLQVGNETVMFRHEEKFHHPAGIGCILDDTLSDEQIKKAVARLHQFSFERVGQKLDLNLIALRQKGDTEQFVKKASTIAATTQLGIVLMAKDPSSLKGALEALKDKKPLIYRADAAHFNEVIALASHYKCPVVISADDLSALSEFTKKAAEKGVTDISWNPGIAKSPIKYGISPKSAASH